MIYTVIGCISISDFALLVFIPITITISAIGLKPCVITARIKKFKSIINKNKKKHYEACFQHDIAYEDFKDLNRRTAADEIFCNKGFDIAKNPKLASMVYKFFAKRKFWWNS